MIYLFSAATTGGVYIATSISLFSQPFFTAIALTVDAILSVNEAVYFLPYVVGVDPSNV